jgi:hypothetical protein
MARYRGPCEDCGAPVDRVIRPERRKRCLDCAVTAQARVVKARQEGTDPGLEAMRLAGYETARQIEAQEGEYYEKWMRGILKSMGVVLVDAPVEVDQGSLGA